MRAGRPRSRSADVSSASFLQHSDVSSKVLRIYLGVMRARCEHPYYSDVGAARRLIFSTPFGCDVIGARALPLSESGAILFSEVRGERQAMRTSRPRSSLRTGRPRSGRCCYTAIRRQWRRDRRIPDSFRCSEQLQESELHSECSDRNNPAARSLPCGPVIY